MSSRRPYKLDRVAIRMVKEPPLYSSEPLRSPEAAVKVIADMLRQYDREAFCIVNLRNDLSPINMNIVSPFSNFASRSWTVAPYRNETNTALWRSSGRKSRRLKNEARVFLLAKTMSRRLEWKISAHGRG